MAINLVKSKVKELEELYSYLLTKYLESKGKGQTLTPLYNGVSKLEQGGFEKRSSLQYDSDNDAFILKYAYIWEWTSKVKLIKRLKSKTLQFKQNQIQDLTNQLFGINSEYLILISNKQKISTLVRFLFLS